MGEVRAFGLQRDALVRRPGRYGPGRRAALSLLTDGWLDALFQEAAAGATDLCLVAVGGYGRQELAPGSDIDLLLLHRGTAAQVAPIADRIWYPIWDAGIALDHSVRTVAEARRLASVDIKFATPWFCSVVAKPVTSSQATVDVAPLRRKPRPRRMI